MNSLLMSLSMSLELVVDVIGWLGAAVIVVGYLTTSFPRFSVTNFQYQMLNVTGALGLVVNGWYHGAVPSAFLNIVWALIAVASMYSAKKV